MCIQGHNPNPSVVIIFSILHHLLPLFRKGLREIFVNLNLVLQTQKQ